MAKEKEFSWSHKYISSGSDIAVFRHRGLVLILIDPHGTMINPAKPIDSNETYTITIEKGYQY